MRNMLRCRRGSAAFATVAALVPLIGVVALGGEAGSWYVTKQHGQNAADAAAYSGGLILACQIQSGGACAGDTQSVAYRGKEFAAQNGFCNAGDTSYPSSRCLTSLPSGTSQSVQVASLTSWNGQNGNFVQATVSQQQPTYLAKLLGLSTVNIGAAAVAQIQPSPKPPCILALTGSVSFQGSPTVTSPNCGLASNSTASNAIAFTGNGSSINAPSYTTGGCSETGGTQCSNNVSTYDVAPVPNPLSGLDSAMSSLTTSNFSGGQCGSLTASASCYNGDPKKGFNFSAPSYNLNGTYFFTGPVTIGGNVIITGTANLVLFGNATLGITGTPTIQLTAETNPQVPPALSSVSNLMKGLLIYDPEPYSKQGVNVTGNSNSFFNGTVYVPNAPVTYGGNSSASTPKPGCFQVIAYAVTFSGNTNLDESGCPALGAVTPLIQYVRLVQ